MRAVDDVSLDIGEREVVGLVGESGCGKSTLGRGILGLLPHGARAVGEVNLDGQNLYELPPSDVPPVPGAAARPDLPGADDPAEPADADLRALQRDARAARAEALATARSERRSLETLGRMGIPPTRFEQYPHEFSGGMRQRIMIALALVLRPKVLVADEPTTSLDVIVEGQILALLADLKQNFGTALLLITHNLGIVAEACDRMAVMYAGKIVEEGPVRDVFREPAHPYTRELLRSTISLETTELHSIPGSPPNLIDPPPGCRFHPRCPNAMRVCAELAPIEQRLDERRRVLCWLHGPEQTGSGRRRAAARARADRDRG